MNIDIVLGTYNGGAHLGAQLDSLLAQSVSGWRLLIRDDGSKDNTVAIIRDYERRYSGRIVEVDAGGGNVGVVGNFARLMEASNADYVMFCDQDDVWYPDKIEKTLKAMHVLEDQYGMAVPLLVHTDARLVDVNLKPTHPSFHRALSHDMSDPRLAHALVQNTAHGCTVMMNRPLVKLALPFPREVRMHDMWVHLLALAVGHTAYLDMATLDYRQHGRNVIGALPQSHDVGQAKRKAGSTMQASLHQAVMVLDRIGVGSAEKAESVLVDFIKAMRMPWLPGTWKLLMGYCPKPRLKNAIRIVLR